jgi:VanZ family protein
VSIPKQRSTSKPEITLNKLSFYLQGAVVRWTLTLAWTALAVMLMLSPSGDGTTVTTVSWVSELFGGSETTDAIGHIIINTVLALLWCWTLSLYATTAKTTRIVLIGGIIWCFGAELSQFFIPERGTSLIDLVANIIGVLIGLMIYRLLLAFSMKRCHAN